ncbi:MAG: UvrD-helicase domain-containing protein [Bacteroidales bacterium]|nr:UvrD-helicase domain-containing protein [Bacteroidales bacterium]
MIISKASAGSGKTYQLAHTYIDILKKAGEPSAYKHILAVTFTNKATAEMKSRILKYLSEDASCRKMLLSILHDYSSFSVSTIDRFFQRCIKAFSREAGHFADYQISLERDSLIVEAVDRFLSSLDGGNTAVMKWLGDSLSESLDRGEKLKIDRPLYDMARSLKSEQYRSLAEKNGIDNRTAYDAGRLSKIKKNCVEIIKTFQKKAADLDIKYENFKKIPVPKKNATDEQKALFEGNEYRDYCTALEIYPGIFALGFAGAFFEEFDNLLREKNLMCLDESNTLLKDIIDGSDAPFVYEKLGVWYRNFLLDEFQDTSNIQWDNFLPLLRESEGSGGDNLIVGDVKQSIYRWRNSDWRLLGEVVQKEFPRAEVAFKTENYRSARKVVDFNNAFFSFAAQRLSLEKEYSDVVQYAKKEDSQGGYVRVTFIDNNYQKDAVLDSIKSAGTKGAEFSDIAVLVRNNSEGSEIARYLILNKIPVISDESLELKSSSLVRRLVSVLCRIDNPGDDIGGFHALDVEVGDIQAFHSLTDLCEEILRRFRETDEESFEGETAFIQGFMDDVREWSEQNGNNLSEYLEHWSQCNKSIASPEDSNAVRILTIHKSKGLEFPYLIFPYANKVSLFKNCVKWCYFASPAGSSLIPEAAGLYPVSLAEKTGDSWFGKDYEQEIGMQKIDNMNLFYVALTRAGKSLHIIAKQPSKDCIGKVEKGKAVDWKDFSQLLYAYCHQFGWAVKKTETTADGSEISITEYETGTPYDFSMMQREQGETVENMPLPRYPSIPIGSRLEPSSDAKDFFSLEEGETPSEREVGIAMHEILSRVRVHSDLDASVAASLASAQITSEGAQEAKSLLAARIAAHPQWFGGDAEVMNETAIIGADGQEKRPDRVLRFPDGKITVIDYKFGEPHSSYNKQVREYMKLYRDMGAENVEGFIWYVRSDEVVAVSI